MDASEKLKSSGNWYYLVMGDQRGPIDRGCLQRLAETNEIARDSFVRFNDGDWLLADKVEGLFPVANCNEMATKHPEPPQCDVYYQVMGEERGPITVDAWQRLAATSRDIGRDTLVRQNGGEWVTADAVRLSGFPEISDRSAAKR